MEKFHKIRISRKTKKRLKKNKYAPLFYKMWVRELKDIQIQKKLKKFWGI